MSKQVTRYLEKNEFENWDSFVKNQDNSNVYQTSKWLNTIFSQQNKKITVKIIACFDKENNIIGGIVFGNQKKFGINLIVQPYLSQYSGILISDRNTKYPSKNLKYKKEIIESILDILEKDHDVIDLILPPELNDTRPFKWRGYNNEVKYTFKIYLNEIEEFLSVFDPSVRRQIKKAQKQEIKIINGADKNLIKDFYQLINKSYQRQKHKFRFSLEELLYVTETLKNYNTIDIVYYNAYLEDKPIAGQAILFFNKTSYYWLAGGDPQYFNTGVNQSLVYKILLDSKSKNMKYFDFVGANTPSIAQYKATYNFPLTPYYKVKKIKGFYPKLMMKLKETLF